MPNSDVAVTVAPEGNTDSAIVYRVGPGQGVVLSATDIPLTDDGTTRIRIEVTSSDGKNTQTYTVVITRLGGGGETDTTLASLSLSGIEGIELSPPFSSGQRTYTATVDYGDVTDLPTTVAWTVNADRCRGGVDS